jgi:hypothetical protein
MGRFDKNNNIFRHAEVFKNFEEKITKENEISFEIFYLSKWNFKMK